jgi:uncharacterized protein YjbI with pentapeptide repeats
MAAGYCGEPSSGSPPGGRAEPGRLLEVASLGRVSTPPVLPGSTYEGAVWGGGVLEDVDAEDSTFLDCTLDGLTVTGGGWERTSWRGGALTGVRVVGGRFARSRWRDVRVERSAFSGCELYGAHLQGVRFAAGMLDAVNLRGAVVEDVSFEDCVLRDVDLGGARLTRVNLAGCRIERLDLTKATLAEVDLRGSALGIARGLDRLGGAVLDIGQVLELAPALAAHLGVDVRYPQS